jgi:hypothetical protein
MIMPAEMRVTGIERRARRQNEYHAITTSYALPITKARQAETSGAIADSQQKSPCSGSRFGGRHGRRGPHSRGAETLCDGCRKDIIALDIFAAGQPGHHGPVLPRPALSPAICAFRKDGFDFPDRASSYFADGRSPIPYWP